MLRRRSTYAAPALAGLAGAIGAVQPLGVAAVIAGIAGTVALLTSRTLRIGFVVLGGVFILQSSTELDPLKIIYLSGVALAVVMGLDSRPPKLLVAASALWVAVLAVSFFVSLLQGTAPVDWLRDATAYAFFAAFPFLAADAARIRREALVALLFVAGALTTASFVARFGGGHNVIADVGQFVLVSQALPGALLAYASSRIGGRRIWALAAMAILAAMLLSGTRSALVLLAIPATVLLLQQDRARIGRWLVAAGLAALLVTPALGSVVDLGRVADRFASLGSFSGAAAPDQSYLLRLAQIDADLGSFASSPLLGVGPGRVVHVVPAAGLSVTLTQTDSPFNALAKFGLLGIVGVIFTAVALLKSVPRNDMRAAILGFLAASGLYQLFESPLEEKGFSLALILLFGLALAEDPSARIQRVGRRDSRPRQSLA